MLVVLMYHRVIQTSFSHQADVFLNHLTHISQQYPIVVPGDKLQKGKINICLTFDDAYFDFYHSVFPILKKLNIPAVLAIPSGLILDTTDLDNETRLNVPYERAIDSYQTHATLCTWDEINEMVATDLVVPAAHGLTHQPLTRPELSLEQEVVYAKQLLQEKTDREIDTFIYPYGRMSHSINQFVNRHYNYTMRIGSALNVSWQNMHKVIYRINAEEFWPQEKTLFTPQHKLVLWSRFLSNTCRQR
jgi:peptidoglycan/xylan/chitin deacetylase (PgdA/CDA1 family)